MAEVFAGTKVRMAVNEDLTSNSPMYIDAGYVPLDNLVAFPEITTQTETYKMEAYNEDYERVILGAYGSAPVTIQVAEVADDEAQSILDKYLNSMKMLRFRIMWVEKELPPVEGMPAEEQYSGPTAIFDAYVTSTTLTGGADQTVIRSYTLSPFGKVTRDVTNLGEYVRRGQYGVGGGTVDYPGPTDTNSYEGNRWVNLSASSSQNPFADSTAGMTVQSGEQGWTIVGSATGNMMLRARNRQLSRVGDWTKIYTSAEPPTAAEIGAIPTVGDAYVQGNLKANSFYVTDTAGTTITTQINKDGITTNVLKITGSVNSPNSNISGTSTLNIVTANKLTAQELISPLARIDTGTVTTLSSTDFTSFNAVINNKLDVKEAEIDDLTINTRFHVGADASFQIAGNVQAATVTATDKVTTKNLEVQEVEKVGQVNARRLFLHAETEAAEAYDSTDYNQSRNPRISLTQSGQLIGYAAEFNPDGSTPKAYEFTNTIQRLENARITNLSVVNNIGVNNLSFSGALTAGNSDAKILLETPDQVIVSTDATPGVAAAHWTEIRAGVIYIDGKPIWHDGNIPNVVQMGAVPLVGNSTITGDVIVKGRVSADSVRIGPNIVMTTDLINIGIGTIRIGGQEIFHPGNPPTAAQCKAVPLAGNSRMDGELTANKLFEYNTVTSTQERVFSPLNRPTAANAGVMVLLGDVIDFGLE